MGAMTYQTFMGANKVFQARTKDKSSILPNEVDIDES